MKKSTEILKIRQARTPESHAEGIGNRFVKFMLKKYLAGQKEHGGRLWGKPTARFSKEEAVDLWTYLDTAEEQADLVTALLEEAVESKDWETVQYALNVVKTGNVAGQELAD